MLKADSHEDLHMYEVSLPTMLCLPTRRSHAPHVEARLPARWEFVMLSTSMLVNAQHRCLTKMHLQARLPRSVSTGSMISPRESQGA